MNCNICPYNGDLLCQKGCMKTNNPKETPLTNTPCYICESVPCCCDDESYAAKENECGDVKNLLIDLVDTIASNRAKIINDFIETYVASRADWFLKNPERLRRINLIEKINTDGLTRTFTIDIKRGRLLQKKSLTLIDEVKELKGGRKYGI